MSWHAKCSLPVFVARLSSQFTSPEPAVPLSLRGTRVFFSQFEPYAPL